ncbi:MAG TPA: ABC transporter ATP-binding protein [Geminicoccus sp.]|jgi:ABC-type sugar transport system ATPase subunit|uniref:ABC transporter ATP-binding protein n=1 Tax=Geminicoccus sp. TaxID=2024832 RepID=UPI002E3786AD|nr:ABC transporter ATP-binding protein [Geminicoccus sp.]HEX2529708.1 ABC transporter ATP-binding protein [Geminicoccus sp.]
MARVALDHLSVRFGQVAAVDDISIAFEQGEFVVLLGPSGCGKTTTLRCIAGLEQPTSGKILFDQDEVSHLPPRARQVAMVFQFVSLYPHLNVRDNIAFPLRARGENKAEITRKIAWMNKIFDLGEILGRRPGTLPPGARQKAALARAVVREPRVLLLDEPLSAIDEQFREEMRWELRHLQKELGMTTIHVTHDQREAMSLADRVVLMRNGKIVQAGPPAELFNDPVDEFAAHFIGSPSVNLIEATFTESGVALGDEQVPIAVPEQHLAAIRKSGLQHGKVGIRPHSLTPASSGEFGAVPVSRPISYAIGRERFLDFELSGQIWRGVLPSGSGEDVPSQMHLDPSKIFYFTPEGVRLPVA